MKALDGKRRPRPDPRGHEAQRKGLLAKVHIAKKELALGDLIYRDVLRGRYGVESAADLRNERLEDLVRYFRQLGWKPRKGSGQRSAVSGQRKKQGQIEALRERARAIAGDLENGEARLDGLVKKVCGVDCLEWCSDVGKLKRLVVVLDKIVVSDQWPERSDYADV